LLSKDLEVMELFKQLEICHLKCFRVRSLILSLT
jgi:hypothetical protein